MKGRDVILGTLLKHSMSGYDIKLVFEDVFSHFFDGSFGMIYPTLRQLEKEGMIDKDIVIQEGKPNKNVYSITKKGVKEFNQYLEQNIQKDVLCSDFLMRMYFGEYVDKPTLIKWVEEEINTKRKSLEQLYTKKADWAQKMSMPQEICLEVGISQYAAQIETLERKLIELKQIKEGIGENVKGKD
ncbi:PadR family transcriptional regulator [Rummeliibacillus suwonensis]|uniref:PadR family transcriptional regulator n=1 Tax=Rummeliibacillus suwonensis TaxID=1306154 RepID=UPI0011B3D17C|nr:PadR family transcriptional regulator [Rummeliibacillus suwonensis]